MEKEPTIFFFLSFCWGFFQDIYGWIPKKSFELPSVESVDIRKEDCFSGRLQAIAFPFR